MKKVLLAFAILGFVACNNEGDKTPEADTTVTAPVNADTTAPVATPDTTKKDTGATTAPAAADTTAKH